MVGSNIITHIGGKISNEEIDAANNACRNHCYTDGGTNLHLIPIGKTRGKDGKVGSYTTRYYIAKYNNISLYILLPRHILFCIIFMPYGIISISRINKARLLA